MNAPIRGWMLTGRSYMYVMQKNDKTIDDFRCMLQTASFLEFRVCTDWHSVEETTLYCSYLHDPVILVRSKHDTVI